MEKKKIILNADEAWKRTLKNQATFQDCMNEIERQSGSGLSFALFAKEIQQEALDKLMDMGYMIGSHLDHMNIKLKKITWKS